jgi:hypothetical protein
MTRLKDVTRYVRAKNAGPYWVTIDIFFTDEETFRASRNAGLLSAESIAAIYEVDPAMVKRFEVESLAMIKISYPRKSPQGGILERDMHSGQSYVRLLDLDLDANGAGCNEAF